MTASASMNTVQANRLIALLETLTHSRDDFLGMAICGSWARGNPRENSDLDFLIIVRDAAIVRRNQNWIRDLNFLGADFRYIEHKTATYGVVWSAHIDLEPAAEIELAFANAAWASVDPIDAGTRQVVTDAFKILVDKDGLLGRLCNACA